MGAYLSQPNKEKVSSDELNEYMAVGASSMQGWRNSQEDAHNCILDFDTSTSFFAVYDGHGGAEVATYCAAELPDFLKALATYQAGNMEDALREAFMGFDSLILEPHVGAILRDLANERNGGEDTDTQDDDEDVEDLVELHEESHLPLSEVLEKYKGGISMPSLKRPKTDGEVGEQPQSLFMRGRRAAAVAADAANKAAMDPDSKPEGSSTSAAAAAAAAVAAAIAASSNEAGPSTSKSVLKNLETDGHEDESTVSSSSSRASKVVNNNNINNATAADGVSAESKPTASASANTNGSTVATSSSSTTTASSSPTSATAPAAPVVATAVATSATAAVVSASQVGASSKQLASPDSSHAVAVKENEQNGSVTSSVTKPIKAEVSTSALNDATVSGSSDAAKKIQNGTVGSTSSTIASQSPASAERTAAAISSTSKEEQKVKSSPAAAEDDEEDADYEAVEDNSSAEEGNELNDDDEDDDDDSTDFEMDLDGEHEVGEVLAVADPDDDSTDDELEYEVEDIHDHVYPTVIEEVPGKDSGCTAVVAVLKGRDLYVANAGDSRCVVSRNGRAIDMSLDHKPEDDEESMRILKAGGRVTLDGRVNGGLNLSRAIGDHAYKLNTQLPPEEQMITALPDIKKLIIQPEDEFMVLACDGIWNYMSSEEVVEFVGMRLKDESKKLSQICEELFDNCLAPNTAGDGTGCDNMTAVIIRFNPKLLELETKIDPKETEDVVAKKPNVTAAVTDEDDDDDDEDDDDDDDEMVNDAEINLHKSLKRALDDMNSNEVDLANKTKRMKTDEVLTTSTTISTLCATDPASSSSSSDSSSSNSSATSSTTTTTSNSSTNGPNATTKTTAATITAPTTTSTSATSEEKQKVCTSTVLTDAHAIVPAKEEPKGIASTSTTLTTATTFTNEATATGTATATTTAATGPASVASVEVIVTPTPST